MIIDDRLKPIFDRLPPELLQAILALPKDKVSQFEEIRLRAGRPAAMYTGGREYALGFHPTSQALENILSMMIHYSVYAYAQDIANGFITLEGGHRIGICGKVVLEGGNIKAMKEISSLNIRRSKELIGVSDAVLPYIFNKAKKEICNTLIISPPKCGKTTLLRDLVRNLSQNGVRVGVVDERSEIAAMFAGTPQNNVGEKTDVLDGCPKDQGMMMMIRSMSPEVIVSDEIGKEEDVPAIEAALCAGINVITTIHGKTHDDITKSRINVLIEKKIFQRIIFLSGRPTTGSINGIFDENGKRLDDAQGGER